MSPKITSSSEVDSTSKNNIANSIDFYIYDLAILGIIYIGLLMINKMGGKHTSDKTMILNKDGLDNDRLVKLETMSIEQRRLRKYFLIGSLFIKAATWIKAPYLFALYNRIHGFTRQDIGVLYAVDSLSSLFFGPIIGSLSDIFGNKSFCVSYGIFVSSHIYLRLTGSRQLAYFAQGITGICSCILDVSFETWFVNESALLFKQDQKNEKESYRSEIFAKQVQIDCLTSIFLTGTATILYMNYGIKVPFIASSIFAILASLFILFFWKESSKKDFENYEQLFGSRKNPSPEEEKKYTFFGKIATAVNEIKKDTALLCVGLVESGFKICMQLFIFIWTPLLEESIGGFIHPGSIFALFMLSRLSGSELLAPVKNLLGKNLFTVTSLASFAIIINFFLSYYINDFRTRLYLFIFFDGLSGIYEPAISVLKSTLISHTIRSTVMNLFRVPRNIFAILLYFFSKYLTTYQICLVIMGFACITFTFSLIGLYILEKRNYSEKIKRSIVTKIFSRELPGMGTIYGFFDGNDKEEGLLEDHKKLGNTGQ